MEEPILFLGGGNPATPKGNRYINLCKKKKNTPPYDFCIMITVENLMCHWLY